MDAKLCRLRRLLRRLESINKQFVVMLEQARSPAGFSASIGANGGSGAASWKNGGPNKGFPGEEKNYDALGLRRRRSGARRPRRILGGTWGRIPDGRGGCARG